MRDYNERACEELDAALFSGDDFENPESLKELEAYIARWQREISKIKKGIENENPSSS